MLEPPADLGVDQLRDALVAQYGLAITDLVFLPIGHDATAWVYRVATTTATYFLKVRQHLTSEAALIVPRLLVERGIRRVVGPIPTLAGGIWGQTARYVVILYPYLVGETGMQRGMTAQQWHDLGLVMRQIHDFVVPPDQSAVIPRESFRPAGVDQIRALDIMLSPYGGADSLTREFAEVWATRRQPIELVVQRAEALSRQVAQLGLPSVLCHADIHTANVMLDHDDQVWIVDWDEVVLAPRERDLMFVIGGIHRMLVTPEDEARFLGGYGEIDISPVALAYYRYAWATADIGAYGDQVVARPDLGPVTRRASVASFLSLFEPGAIVDLARSSIVEASNA
jgi:spectinomycin phosphotransferase